MSDLKKYIKLVSTGLNYADHEVQFFYACSRFIPFGVRQLNVERDWQAGIRFLDLPVMPTSCTFVRLTALHRTDKIN